MVVSIFTDISIDRRNLQGGFAFYIGCRSGQIRRSGALKDASKEANTAEAHCIVNALTVLISSNLRAKTINIYTDNTDVINCFYNAKLHQAVRGGQHFFNGVCEIKLAMAEYCVSRGMKVRDYKTAFSLLHVKAHTGKDDKMSVINDWCDTESRAQCMALPKKK